MTIDRRRFLNWFLGTTVGAFFASVLYPVARYVSPPSVPEAATNQVEAGPVNDPELLDKGFKIVRFGSDPVILVRASENEYHALTATCTHLDCIVEYRSVERLLWCNCHNGAYDLTGRNVAGPPPKPLTAYAVHVVPAQGSRPASLVVSKT